ncbi:argininosuccinate synthase [Nocardioides bruguierae]|uniref:Argininosuccinate synthase n=1 Tax=Nocardioides bruguierae TaxID=2945102 RepID=A0A9X2DAG8_9ACTN|nr:argininosuccinate synthase [Nocardioides bruguierae]MCM0621782.1 argininosuccinate synthase [Nocardioides bruguierae]
MSLTTVDFDRGRVALAYSGDLDTTACIPYLKEHMGCSYVLAVAVDLGQGDELEPLRLKALASGADEAIVIDARHKLILDYGLPALQANAVYNGKYPLSSALARPVITDVVLQAAKDHHCGSVAHGSTGKGNDQIRFDLGIKLLDLDMQILAPAREWSFTRPETVDYIQSHGIHAHVSADKPWGVDLNLLGRNIEAGPIEDLDWVPTEEVWALTADPTTVDHEPDDITVDFHDGVPTGLDGVPLHPVDIFGHLNHVAGRHGIGRLDVIEDRIMGMKSRELYEAPAVTVLLTAHHELEQLALPRDVTSCKAQVDHLLAQYIYDGLWHSPLREHLSAFVKETQAGLNGSITLRLSRGTVTAIRRSSSVSLYNHKLVTYGAGCTFPTGASEGFIEITALAGREWRRARNEIAGPAKTPAIPASENPREPAAAASALGA